MTKIIFDLVEKDLIKLKRKDNKEYTQIKRLCYALQLRGRSLDRPQASLVRDNIYELRPSKHRVFYTFKDNNVVLLALCKKSGSKVSSKDWQLVKKRQNDL